MKLSELLFPPKCVSCGALVGRAPDGSFPHLCADCRRLWDGEKNERCEVCGARVCECTCMPKELSRAGCAALCKAVFYHSDRQNMVQSRLIYRFKRERSRRTPEFLAGELLPILQTSLPELFSGEVICTYVPRGRGAFLQYGTDQAKMLAGAIAERAGVPMQKLLVHRRVRGAESQKSLSVAARLRNATLAFSTLDGVDLHGKTILLADDISTTGASMAACARRLRKRGAARIVCVAVASSVSNQSPEVAVAAPAKTEI